MTNSTTTAAESPSVAVTDAPVPEESAPAPVAAEPVAPVRRWKTPTLVITAIIALVVGLGIGAAGGWAIAQSQRPQFGSGQFPGGGDGQFPGNGQPPGDGQMPGNGEAPQGGDGTTDDAS